MTSNHLKFTTRGLERKLSFVLFLLLFPGFFFYQTAIAFNIIPPFLGGFFSPIALVATATLIPLLIHGMVRKNSFFTVDLIFWLVIFYWILILFTYIAFDSSSSETKDEVIEFSIRAILANIACYVVARSLTIESRRLTQLLIVSLIGFFTISIINASEGLLYLKTIANDQESVATYQGFARSVLVVGVLALLVDTRFSRVVIIFLLGAITLFINGARSEFVFFLIASFVYGWRVVFKSKKQRVLLIFSIIPTLLFSLFYFSELASALPETRMSELFDIKNSSSALARMDLMWQAWDVIKANPLFGSYAAYVATNGIGSYAHNLLSAWADLGLLGMALYILSVFIVFRDSRKLTEKNASPQDTLPFMFAAILLFAYIFAKNYTYMLFGLMMGFHAKNLSSKMLARKNGAN